jgi:hypothetical protein
MKAEGVTEISPVLVLVAVRKHLRRENVPQNKFPLRLDWGEGQGEVSKSLTRISRIFTNLIRAIRV